MPISKDRISSPLEAGCSILDLQHFPLQLVPALEYVSKRLVRKRLHVSLVVVRKNIEILPAISSPKEGGTSNSATTSPTKSLFNGASSTIFKSLSRSSSSCSSSSSLASSSSSSLSSSPVYPPHSATQSPTISQAQNITLEISLLYASAMTAKAERILRQTIEKAEKKFELGSGWLSILPSTNDVSCPAMDDLVRRSLAQNEILFSSEGLTLLSLDHIYAFKCLLQSFSRSLSAADLTSAVDELRRLVLSRNGKRVTKGYLMRIYNWLGVSLAALVEVNEAYKAAYGGRERHGGIDVQSEERSSPPPPPKTAFNMTGIRKLNLSITTHGLSQPFFPDGISSSGSSSSSCSQTLEEDRGPHLRGAVTPNGFEDITPITRGEWCCLMVGDGWKEGRFAAIETC